MKEAPTNSGKTYSVHTANGCTVSDNSGWSKEIEAPDGYFTAHGSSVQLSDDEATMREVFKLAPYQKLRLLGVVGGNDVLPAGYTRLEYLESDGTQWVDTEFFPTTSENFQASLVVFAKDGSRFAQGASCAFLAAYWVTPIDDGWRISGNAPNNDFMVPLQTKVKIYLRPDEVSFLDKKLQLSTSYLPVRSEIPSSPENGLSVKLFAYANGVSYQKQWLKGYIYEFQAQYADKKTRMIPALDKIGAPCFYCLARKIAFYNKGTGALIAGLETQKQLDAMLRKLPDRTGLDVGTLQVRLADELQTPENEAKLDAMLAKNWEISQAA